MLAPERVAALPRAFGALFPERAAGRPIDFTMFGRAIAEFEFTLTFADAPIDRFARGDRAAMTRAEKRGALVFFGAGRLRRVPRRVAGESNEMFSDFAMHVVGVPQIAPVFGVGTGNVIFDGPGEDEDFGLEQSRAIRPTATSSAPRRCATSRCSRRSSTTAPSRGSRTRFGTTTIPRPPRSARTSRRQRASHRTSRRGWDRSNRSSNT